MPEAAEPGYLAGLEQARRRAEAAGDHVWVFRSRNDPRSFLEFRESGRGQPPGPEEGLRQLARYRDDDILWDEVRLGADPEGA